MNLPSTRNERSGFALILVLLLLAAGTVFAFSYQTSSTIKVVGSQNLLYVARAKYVAESGLHHAIYVLASDPELLVGSQSVPLGPFRVDGSDDAYSFYALADPNIAGRFHLTSEGIAREVRRTCSYTVMRNRSDRVMVSHGLLIDGVGASLPPTLTVNGDIHINGDFLMNNARVHGNVSAFGGVSDPFGRIDGEVTTGADKINLPDIRTDYYKGYRLGASVCAAVEKTTTELLSDDVLNRGGAIGPANVGGVVWLKPEINNLVKIMDDVEFRGTIIIEGDLVLEGVNITMTPVKGFPAAVVTGRIIVAPGSEATVNGLVVSGGGIVPKDGQGLGSRTTINGGLVSGWIGYDSGLQGVHELNYEGERCELYDFSDGTAEENAQVTISILDYK